VVILILLAFYLSLYIATFSSLIGLACESPAWTLMMMPVFWVCLEYLRGVLFTGFPWGLIGYSQYHFLKLIQISDIFGVYGVSFLIVSANGIIFFALLYLTGRKWRKRPVSGRLALFSAISLACMVGLALGYGNVRLKSIDRMIAKDRSVDVSVIQGNIPQDEKWDAAFCNKTIDTYFRLSGQAMKSHPGLIVWPETAAPFYFGYEADLTKEVTDGIRDMRAYFLIGAPTVEFHEKKDRYYNSAYLISPEGRVVGRYDKVHLVPFGEYVPLKKFLPFLGHIVAQVGDFNSGKIGNTLNWKGIHIGVLICYEVIFPELALKLVQNNAGLLVSITNDAWFGNTSAPYQDFYMAAFRSIENRRSLARAANTGISGFVDPAGRVMGQTGLFYEAAMTRKVPIIQNYQTIYTRYGDLLVWACFIASILYLMIRFINIKFLLERKKQGGQHVI